MPREEHDRPYRTAYAGRRVCVTGGAGFIGSHLCDALVGLGADVSVIDDLSNGRRENLEAIEDRVTFVEGSILDMDALRRAAGDASIIFHQAAIASVPRSVREPVLYHRVDTEGTLNVLETARAGAGERVVFASSSSVYGDQPTLPKVETMAPDPRSPYAAAKCAAEQFVRAYARCYGMAAVSLRYFNIFGPRQRPDSPYAAVLPLFCKSLCAGEAPVIYGDGGQTRDFTHVDNAVHANLLAGAATGELVGQALNVATGHGLSVLDLLAAVAAQLGVEPRCTHDDPRPGDVRDSHAAIDAARALIGYEPVVPFESGLDGTIRYYADLLAGSGIGG